MTRDSTPPIDLEQARITPLPEDESEALARALRAAWSPADLDPAVNEALIAAALEDPLAPPSEEELAESARLRSALEGHGSHPSAELARALRAAAKPGSLEREQADRLLGSALSDAGAVRRGRVIFVAFGAASTAIAALAASWFLLLRPALQGSAPADLAARADLAVSRSTAAMFSEKFDTAATTERVDRIVSARSRELRSNRYALWGVR